MGRLGDQFHLTDSHTKFLTHPGGVLNALDLATDLGVRRFVYVSTAYTAGRRSGLVRERLHTSDSTFNNVYEETECIAEHELARRAGERGVDCHILRPSIVVGSSCTHAPAGSETGLYGFLRAIHALRRELRGAGSVRLSGDPATPLHLVPVDRLVAEMISLAAHGFPGGCVHHLTPRQPLLASEVLDIVCRALGTPSVHIEPSSGGDRTALESAIDQHMEFYGAYLRDPKALERSSPGNCELSACDVDGLVRQWLHERATGAAPAIRESLSRAEPRGPASGIAARNAEDREVPGST